MTSPWIFQLGSLAGVSTPAGRAQHIRAPAHPTAQAAGCRGQVGQPRWAPCRALESSGSTAGCFLSLQTLTLGRRGLSDLLQMVSRSHLLETLALVTGKPVAAVAGGGRRQSLLLSWCWQSNPCPTPLLCPIQRRALLSFLVLQVLVDGREAEKAAEEPHGCLHQVCLGFCPGKRPTSPPASWGPTRFLPLGGCSESPPVIGPAPVQGPCWAVMGVRSLGLTAASRWLVVL